MRRALWFFGLSLLFIMMGAVLWAPQSQAQDVCPGATLFVNAGNGEDTATCGPDGQPPCRTLAFAIERIGDCREPLQIWDNDTNQVLYVANVKAPPPWGQLIGLAIGLAAGIALGYFWRKSRTTAAVAVFVFMAALWSMFGAARPANAQGECPGSQVNFRNIGANTAACVPLRWAAYRL